MQDLQVVNGLVMDYCKLLQYNVHLFKFVPLWWKFWLNFIQIRSAVVEVLTKTLNGFAATSFRG